MLEFQVSYQKAFCTDVTPRSNWKPSYWSQEVLARSQSVARQQGKGGCHLGGGGGRGEGGGGVLIRYIFNRLVCTRKTFCEFVFLFFSCVVHKQTHMHRGEHACTQDIEGVQGHTHARTHIRTYARTHARTHTHTIM